MRYRWYLQTFNILDYSLSAIAAWFVGRWLILERRGGSRTTHCVLRWPGSPRCVVFVAVNHVLLGRDAAARARILLRETRPLRRSSISPPTSCSLPSASRSYAFWETGIRGSSRSRSRRSSLVHRSLSVPQLQAEARVDPKTGLYNARHFATDARRGDRPRAPLRAADVADHGRPRSPARHQQHLRPPRGRRRAEGHRRGLPRAASALRRAGALRRRGVLDPPAGDAARAGDGDRRAHPPRGRRARRSTSRPRSEPIRATVSIGVAGFPKDGTDANELIHQADLAVYRAQAPGTQPRPRRELRAVARRLRIGPRR